MDTINSLQEIWKLIPNCCDRYEVSNFGRVRSVPYFIVNTLGRRYDFPSKIVHDGCVPMKSAQATDYVRIFLTYNQNPHPKYLHILVAEAFVPNDNPSTKTQVYHINGNLYDNRAMNLAWREPSSNYVEDGEEWRPVVGYEGYYEVSSLGRVKTCVRPYVDARGGQRIIPSRFLKQEEKNMTDPYHCGKYKRVTLTINNVSKHKSVHRLVAAAFAANDNPNIKIEVNHKNGRRDDNRACNLEWVTPNQNVIHAKIHELYRGAMDQRLGSDVHNAAFTWEQVQEIRDKYANGVTSTVLAKEYNAGVRTIMQCVRGETYTTAPGHRSISKRNNKGCSRANSLFTKDDISAIRKRYANGERVIALAKAFNVAASTISRIVHGVRY